SPAVEKAPPLQSPSAQCRFTSYTQRRLYRIRSGAGQPQTRKRMLPHLFPHLLLRPIMAVVLTLRNGGATLSRQLAVAQGTEDLHQSKTKRTRSA
ncbi:hypothetical protein GGI08_009375, partial [Coemansia sp. S2]